MKVNNGREFRAQEHQGTVGEEAPFYRARKLPVTEFLGRSTEEPEVAPDCTPERVQHHYPVRSRARSHSGFHSGYAKQQNTHTKNATTFASELRLANSGFLKI
jgi:hypothetical protein